MRYLLLLATVLLFVIASAQVNLSKESAKETIAIFFEGFHTGDTLLMRATMLLEMQINTMFLSKTKDYILEAGTVNELLNTIANRPKEQVWEEKLLGYTIQINHTLANVWTPYSFSVNGNLSHCGANNFILVGTPRGMENKTPY